MPPSYQDYQKQVAELKAEAEVAGSLSSRYYLADPQHHEDCGLIQADLQRSTHLPEIHRKPVEIKYRDESSENTWSGRDRMPNWLIGKEKSNYLIK